MVRQVDYQFNDSIVLSDGEYALAVTLSEASLATFKETRGYYRNTANSHLIGRVGEIGVARWFEDAGYSVDRLFEQAGRERECDLMCDGRRVEVKTWTAQWWPAWGRCVAVGQLAALAQKADFVLWATAEVDRDSAAVDLQGWSSIEDVRAALVL